MWCKSVRKRHFPVVVMVAVTFAIGGDMSQLRPVSLIRKTGQEAIGKSLAVIQQSFERHALRYRAVIEKNADRFA